MRKIRTIARPAAEPLGRRELLRQGLVWGGSGVAAATLGSTAFASPAGAGRGHTLVYDVACLGDTFRWIAAPGTTPPGDLRGSTFSVEGRIYSAGTISGKGFDPSSARAIGTWFCRGWLIIAPGRPEPHVLSTQEYVFGDITSTRLFPPDTLTSSGLEGSADESQVPERAVIGGTGEYAGARGVVLQHGHGTNTTTLTTLGGIPAPNFRFEFRLD
jgi:hypothetical protein